MMNAQSPRKLKANKLKNDFRLYLDIIITLSRLYEDIVIDNDDQANLECNFVKVAID